MKSLTVGMVNIKVSPNMKGFKKKVEAAVKGLRAVELDVNPNMKGFRTKVKAATKGMKAKVDVYADTKTLPGQIKRAVSRATGGKVEIDTVLRTRSRDIQRHTKELGKLLRRGAKQSAITLVTNVDWSLGGQAARQKMTKWLSRLRGQAKSTVKVLEEIEPPSIKTVQISQDNIKKIEREIQALKDLDGVRKRINRNAKNRQYDPRLHEEFQRIQRMGRALRGIKAGNATAEIDKLDDAIRRFHREVDASPVVLDRYGRRLGQIRKEFAAVEEAARRASAPKAGSPTRRIPETFDRRAFRKLRDRANRASMYIRPIGNELKYVWDASRAGAKKANANLRKYMNSVKEHTDRIKKAGSGLRILKVQNDEVVRSNEKATRSFRRMGREVQKSSRSRPGRTRRGFKSVDEVGTERFFGLSRIGWIIAAISAIAAPLIQLVSGAVAALPALGLAAVAALGVTMLGWEGIKTAAEAAVPAVDRAKEAISSVFEERLTPQFAQLGGALDHIRPNLVQLAHGMSNFSQGMVDAVTKGRGLSNINEVVGRTATLFSDLKPFAHDFTAGLLEMGAAGSRSFPKLAEGMNRFGSTFKNAVEEMSDSGALQQAIESTYSVLGSAGMNIGRILRQGIETFTPEVAASVDNLFTGFADGINGLLPVFSSFSQNIFNVVGELFSQIGTIGESITPQLTTVFDSLGSGFTDLVSGLGDFVVPALEPITNFLAGIAPGAGELLSMIGDGFSKLGEALSGTNLAQFGADLGSHLGDMLSDIAEAGPRFAESMGQMMEAWSEFDAWVSGSAIGRLLMQQAEEVKTGADLYGNALSRIFEGGFGNMHDSAYHARHDILSASAVVGNTVEEVAKTLQDRARIAQSATEIDLTPKIKELDRAKTTAEIEKIRIEIYELLGGAPISAEGMEALKINLPDVEVSGAEEVGGKVAAAAEPAKAAAEQSLTEAFTGIGENLGATVDAELQGAISQMDGAVTTAAEGIGNSLGEALGGVEIPLEGLVSSITTALDGVLTEVTSKVTEIGNAVSTEMQQIPLEIETAFSGMHGSVSGALTELTSSVESAFSGMAADTSAAVSGMSEEISGIFAQIAEDAGAQAEAAKTSFVSAFEAMASEAVTVATGMANAVREALTIDLTESGTAAGNSFATGLRNSIAEVNAAAGEVAAAAKQNFPHSPAKKGPLSGKGYTDHSGIALAKDFAKGMLSQKGTVDKASAELAGAVHKNMNSILIEPKVGFEAHHRKKVLDPVLEANAQKIHDWRKRQEEAEQKSAERIEKINEGKGKQAKKEERIAKERERLAKSNAESYERLLESLEEPDYGSIDRSIQGYWIEGLKEQMQLGLTKAVEETDLAGSIRKVSLGTIEELRKVMDEHPVFAQVEANVNSEHFNEAVTRVIEESGIAYIPVEFVFSNLDQLKSDLGMGDGVVSRAIDQALSFDPSKDDARLAWENRSEIHYHVTDMEEAIRLEQQRERKAMMKLG